jgi:hypothetical protein
MRPKLPALEIVVMRESSVESGDAATRPSEEAVRAELDSILHSAPFKRSERNSRFLRFVCETTLKGEAFKLNEYLIAHAVFERGEDYSPGDDSVVRRQAYSLRQKLQEYYASEGTHDAVRIELPVGRYVPAFCSAAPVPQALAPEPPAVALLITPDAVVTPPRSTPRIPAWWVVAAMVLAASLTVVGWAIGTRTARPVFDRALTEIWGAWLTDPQGAVICFSNPLTTVVKSVNFRYPPDALPHPVELNESQAEQFRTVLDLPTGGLIYVYPGIGHAKMGEALGSIGMTAFFTRAGVPVRATQSRFLSWEDFRSKNLILLGHDEANRWLDPILSKLPLRLAPGRVDKPRRIVNTSPRNGERNEYWPSPSASSSLRPDDYALVSMINGIDDRHRLLLINGIDTEGTEIAEEFLTDVVSMRRLLANLREIAPGHKGPWRFQMVLHADVRDNVPTRVNLVIVRVL